MNNPEHIRFVYEPKRTGHAKDNLYHVMTGLVSDRQWEIPRDVLANAGFELVHNSVRAASNVPSSATFHHYPSGSTVLVHDDTFHPGAKIFGERREIAHNALVTLVKPYGFELKQVEAHANI